MRHVTIAFAAACIALASSQPVAQGGGPFRLNVTLPASARATAGKPGASGAIDGRLLVMIAKDPRAGDWSAVASAKVEPRFQINDSISGQLIFGGTDC